MLSKHNIFEKSDAVDMADADCVVVNPSVFAIVENITEPACAIATAVSSNSSGTVVLDSIGFVTP